MSTFQNKTDKLLQVLQLFLQPDFTISTTTYLDLLLTHLTKEIKKGNQEVSQILQTWLVTAFNTWNDKFKPCQSLITFTIKLIATLSESESIFFHLHQNEILHKASELLEFKKQTLPASIKMAFTEMCVKLVEHPTGRRWIVHTEAWKIILSCAQANCTMYVNKESQKFLSILLIKESYNQALCQEIILAITQPLVEMTHNPQESNSQFTLNKQMLSDQHNLLLSTLELLYAILEYAVFIDLENPIPDMFEDFIGLDNRIKILFEVTISTPFVKILEKLAVLCAYSNLRKSIKSDSEPGSLDEKKFEGFCSTLCYVSNLLMSKKFILDLALTKKQGMIFWHKLNKLKKVAAPHPYKFEIQALTLLILPLCVTVKPKHMKEHCLFEDYIDKLFTLTCQPIQRIAYTMRDILFKNDFPMEYICKSVVEYLLEIVEILDRDAAVICFQTMCYSLKNFVAESTINIKGDKRDDADETATSPKNSYLKKKMEIKYFLDGDPINDKPLLLAALLEGMNVFTEKFKLKWQECVETICVLSIAQDILNHPGVNAKICILALKTCKLAIANFMPPNLVLLSEFDEQTNEIGATLFKRIHDTNWEVQDSVFEVLITVTDLCENKYPPYQKMLLENQFFQVAAELARAENESYVRASALKFISAAVKINALWEKQLCQLNLTDLAMKIVYKENEAVVRREAVVLINKLYKYRSWQKPVISAMIQAMTAAAVLDLDWEVKINALEFWRHFIKSHLTDQGMLDGQFPSVTFSKEHKKIVSLDECKIKQRLNKVLDELARQRCLGVLLVSLKDESDLEVAKTSANIIADLRKILLCYKINEPTPEPPSPKDSATIDTNYIKRPSLDSSSNKDKSHNVFHVIDEIVDASDEKLLASIYRESMRMDGDETDRTKKDNFEFVGKVQSQEFLREILSFDLDGYIKQRTEWLQNYTTCFDSVMDDILMIVKGDVNMMDCY
ncbi:uncharacterized protein LOC131667108 [Phymastichus coffea]|uniref:uncharacterized protein LOC131667108 n=1 Tax=Phymastichus coffea TaxID=108790 RepID=UPI00273B2602|nr:uncharacterized protein LOC131667108 [Phymastichus coffea]XP_058796303.1 uncharacterized protein LOC131667108 [Phymastichus coffea]XP_058796304.1 uncharacterized protein LOC131667108 [Phymastichus coffea]